MNERPRYQPRARFCGILDWLCPWCGYLNSSRLDRTGWRVRCKAKLCRRWFAHGLILHSLGSLRGSGRRLLAPPDVTFPPAELNFTYRSGEPVHRLVVGRRLMPRRRKDLGIKLSPARKDPLLRQLEITAGRAEIMAALEGSGDPRAWTLLSMMLDSAYRHHTFARMCEKAGLRDGW